MGRILQQHAWTEDLDVVIIAGCSLVDVNDYNGNFNDDPLVDLDVPGTELGEEPGPIAKVFPGEKLADCGPRFILGYNATAPADSHDGQSDFTKQILQRFFELEAAGGDRAQSWLEANRLTEIESGANAPTHSAYNACAIDSESSGGYYLHFDKVSNPLRPTVVKVPRSEW